VNLRTIKNYQENPEGKDIINYAGNSGKITLKKLEISKLNLQNVSSPEERSNT
jgi:hypothetical protein